MSNGQSVWAGGSAYEPYVGRWSRLVARKFLDWLDIPPLSHWLDVGCGTGALTETILNVGRPKAIMGVDPSEGYLNVAREQITDQRAKFELGDARKLPVEAEAYDAVVSGLVLNFIPDINTGVGAMVRAARQGGKVAAYVWDYSGKMELMRYFWDAAIELNPENQEMDEGVRFPICRPDALSKLFQDAGLKDIAVEPLDVPTPFLNFDDYWSPFLGGQFPAPDYAMSLSEEDRDQLRGHIRKTLPIKSDGSIELIARAWAVQGVR